MQGMFKANGGCGFVKKPDFLLKTGPNNEVFDPKASLPLKTTLKVRPLLHGDLCDFYNPMYTICLFQVSLDYILTSGFLTFNQVTVYMGEGWYYDFDHTHFDQFSPPDFYARVR